MTTQIPKGMPIIFAGKAEPVAEKAIADMKPELEGKHLPQASPLSIPTNQPILTPPSRPLRLHQRRKTRDPHPRPRRGPLPAQPPRDRRLDPSAQSHRLRRRLPRARHRPLPQADARSGRREPDEPAPLAARRHQHPGAARGTRAGRGFGRSRQGYAQEAGRGGQVGARWAGGLLLLRLCLELFVIEPLAVSVANIIILLLPLLKLSPFRMTQQPHNAST